VACVHVHLHTTQVDSRTLVLGSTRNLAMARRTNISSSSWRTSNLGVLNAMFCAVLLFVAMKMVSSIWWKSHRRTNNAVNNCEPAPALPTHTLHQAQTTRTVVLHPTGSGISHVWSSCE